MSKSDWLEQVHRFLTLEWAKASAEGHSFNEFSYLRAIGLVEEEQAAKAKSGLIDASKKQLGPRLSDLADMLAVRRASASTMLAKLEKEGLVERRCSRLDARAQHFSLTEEGREAVGQGLALYRRFAGQLLAAVGDHQADILALSAGRAAKRARERQS